MLRRRALLALPVALPVAAVAAKVEAKPTHVVAEELHQQIKPFVVGRVFNVEPVPVARRWCTFFVHDGRVDEVSAVRDGGVEFYHFGDYASFEELDRYAVGLPRGSYATCLAEGLIRLGWPPRSRLTADLFVMPDAQMAAMLKIIKEQSAKIERLMAELKRLQALRRKYLPGIPESA